MPSLDTVPPEVLENIAFFAATYSLLGPPSLTLLLVSRRIYGCLSPASNPNLYARIFVYKFDSSIAPSRSPGLLTPFAYVQELQRRCVCLKQIRSRTHSICTRPAALYGNSYEGDGVLYNILLVAYMMTIEDEGHNSAQLREYAGLGEWLRIYWFHELGASGAVAGIRDDVWPANTRTAALAMWLFWFFLRLLDYPKYINILPTRVAISVLQMFSLAAHKYNLTDPSWIDFIPISQRDPQHNVQFYSTPLHITPPPLAVPAILAYLKLANRFYFGPDCFIPFTPWGASLRKPRPNEWDCEWARCVSVGNGNFSAVLTDAYAPGSMEGVWEGLFMYTDFATYAAVLGGAPPKVLQKGIVDRHRQTWKIREHHFLDPSRLRPGTDRNRDVLEPMKSGEALRCYLPAGAQLKETQDGVEVRTPESNNVLQYHRAADDICNEVHQKGKRTVLDVILTGEGHSAWGRFNIVGRIRPCDGLVTLQKEYVDGDRGRWIFKGYLVGNIYGNIAGRWRDTLSPPDIIGYEGCFVMGRRR